MQNGLLRTFAVQAHQVTKRRRVALTRGVYQVEPGEWIVQSGSESWIAMHRNFSEHYVSIQGSIFERKSVDIGTSCQLLSDTKVRIGEATLIGHGGDWFLPSFDGIPAILSNAFFTAISNTLEDSTDNQGAYVYQYPHPAVTVDIVAFARMSDDIQILLIERGVAPFQGAWALPGGFIQLNETLQEAAKRELAEETGLTHVDLEFIGLYDRVDRDPRERVISASYMVLTDWQQVNAGDDARNAVWHSLSHLPKLAFDHDQIVWNALDRLVEKIKGSTVTSADRWAGVIAAARASLSGL